MTYQALARKWRPQDFSSLIGQEPVVTALRNALVDGRIAQAYLFAGIRGVGKTTAARVLAKALSCERGPAPDPCNECLPCVEIARGSDLDVQEIDAATYSKVEQIRELTESLRYGPARNRYKVVVLDEVHRLSRQAFDALLKILEEPPAHLVFIFATTEIEAVPATILSRCQEYSFRRVPATLLASHLRTLCEAEAITASDSALHLLSRASEGSVRDAVALLDQLATYGSGTVGDQEASRLLGHFDLDLLHRLLQQMLAGEGAALAAAVAEVEAVGADPRQLFSRLLAFCRSAIHQAIGAQPPDLPAEEAARLAETARQAGYENLLRLLHHLLASEPLVRRSDLPALAVEVALLRAAELPKLTSVEALLGATPAERPKPSTPVPSAPQGATSAPGDAGAPPTRSSAPTPPAASPEPVAAPAVGSRAPSPAEAIPRFLQAVSRRRQILAAHLEEAQSLDFAGGKLSIVRPPGDDWLDKALERPANRQALDDAVREVWGADATWRPETATPAPPEPAPQAPPVARDTTVQALLDIFDGTIQTVESPSSSEEA